MDKNDDNKNYKKILCGGALFSSELQNYTAWPSSVKRYCFKPKV